MNKVVRLINILVLFETVYYSFKVYSYQINSNGKLGLNLMQCGVTMFIAVYGVGL